MGLDFNNNNAKYQIILLAYASMLVSASYAAWFNALLVVPTVAISYTFRNYDFNIELDFIRIKS